MTRAATKANAARRRAADPNFCCIQWDRFPVASRSWPWQLVHMFAHSRTTFSVATVAIKAASTTEQAREIVGQAAAWGWVARVPDQPTIYVGALKPFRQRPEAS